MSSLLCGVAAEREAPAVLSCSLDNRRSANMMDPWKTSSHSLVNDCTNFSHCRTKEWLISNYWSAGEPVNKAKILAFFVMQLLLLFFTPACIALALKLFSGFKRRFAVLALCMHYILIPLIRFFKKKVKMSVVAVMVWKSQWSSCVARLKIWANYQNCLWHFISSFDVELLAEAVKCSAYTNTDRGLVTIHGSLASRCAYIMGKWVTYRKALILWWCVWG